jgi:hypothetical protein
LSFDLVDLVPVAQSSSGTMAWNSFGVSWLDPAAA